MAEAAGRYARWEFERRFLARRLPEALREAAGYRIGDRYLEGTQLRLRRQEPLGGGETVYKLGQKNAPSPPDFSRTTITTIYLSPREYELLAELPALELQKRRYEVEDGRRFTVDVFGGPLGGLVLAEAEFATAEDLERPLELPGWLLREVSDDVRFTGGALARLSADEAARLVRQVSAERS